MRELNKKKLLIIKFKGQSILTLSIKLIRCKEIKSNKIMKHSIMITVSMINKNNQKYQIYLSLIVVQFKKQTKLN
jgi:hypothetical protein